MAEAERRLAEPVKVRVVVRTRDYSPQEIAIFQKDHLTRFLAEIGLSDFLDHFKQSEFKDPATWDAAFSQDDSQLKEAFPMLTEQDCLLFHDFINNHDLEMRMDPERSEEELTKVFPDENSNMISVQHEKENSRFEFDKILGPKTSQPKLFHFVGVRVCDNAIRGGKGCVVAFGPTGSGKSYSVEGVRPLQDIKNQGVVIQSVDYILKQIESLNFIKSATVSIQCIEIFTRMARDLIEAYGEGDDEFKRVQIQEIADEDAVGGANFSTSTVNFKGASSREVTSLGEAISLMGEIAENRMKADWNISSGCSRSHCLYKINVNSERLSGETHNGSLLLIDLAGSEVLGEEDLPNLTDSQVDALHNSLNMVTQVIEGLRNPEDYSLIPFDKHILALAMKDHVQRGSDVHLLLTVHPGYTCTLQTLSTLNFGASARGLAKSEEKQDEGVLKPVKLFRRTTAESERDDFGAKWDQGAARPPMFRA